MKALIRRDILNILRNPILLRSRIFQTIFLGLFLGGLYFNVGRNYDGHTNQNNANSRALIGMLFYLNWSTFFNSLSAVILTFPIEREVFRKETGARLYGVFPYFLSRNII